MRRIIIFANALVAVLLIGIIAFQTIADRRQVVETAYEHAENLTQALAEHTRQTIDALDLSARAIAEAFTMRRALDQVDPTVVGAVLATSRSRSAASKATFIIGATGTIVAYPMSFLSEIADPRNLPEFVEHQTVRGDRLTIGPPRRSLSGSGRERWYVNLTRRIDNPDGSFAGVAGVALSIDHLMAFYDALRLGKGGAVGLFTRDGVLIARSPFDDAFIGRDLSSGPLFSRYLNEADRGRFTVTYPTDGGTRLTAYRRAADGSVVYVGLAEAEVLAPWRARLVFRGSLGAVVMALFAGASALVLRHAARQRAWSERYSQRLKLLADASARLAKARDLGTAVDCVTAAALALTGASRVVTRLTVAAAGAAPIRMVSTAESYARWRDHHDERDEAAIQKRAEAHQGPVFLTTEDLDRDRDRYDGAEADRPPPRHAVLAVPITSLDGSLLGIIQICDKEDGGFTADDASEMQQLAATAGAAMENLFATTALENAVAEAETRRTEIDTIFSSISDAVYALDDDWRFIYMNDEAERQLTRTRDQLIGQLLWETFPGLEQTVLYPEYHRAKRDRVPVSFEFFYPVLNAWFSVRVFPHDRGLTVYFQDVTRRKEIDERLRQSQKMDAIGQLTGGVAHDFNNLLTVILGHADDLVEFLADGPPEVREEAAAILAAGERAAELTHRLLAFARRQPLRPRTTAVDELVAGMEGLMRRTLGENINIQLTAAADLWEAVVDPNELENALLNIAINARDAMPEGGRLTIETSNVVVDEAYAAENQIEPGSYIVLAVSDTGEGMSPETLSRVFDPFFTTKPHGKGSGLGLSMVYGFARQTGGHVKIYSELGQGTTVRLYIPRAAADAVAEQPPPPPAPVPRGTERILVVEDDEPVRHHTVASLRSLGYTVEACSNGPEALTLLDAGASFDLLLTDVVLSDTMSGKAVAEAAANRLPELKILYMSGYTANAIVHHGRLDEGVMLLSKPFRRAELAQKVREAIET